MPSDKIFLTSAELKKALATLRILQVLASLCSKKNNVSGWDTIEEVMQGVLVDMPDGGGESKVQTISKIHG